MLTFNQIYEKYSDDVYRFAVWMTGCPDEAEDITSETFIKIWGNLTIIRTETLKAYLFKIARNIYLQRLRKNKRLTEFPEDVPDLRPSPQQISEMKMELKQTHEVLMTLSEIDRSAFLLRIQAELPYAEIARVLGISEVAAKVKVHRVRKYLIQVIRQSE